MAKGISGVGTVIDPAAVQRFLHERTGAKYLIEYARRLTRRTHGMPVRLGHEVVHETFGRRTKRERSARAQGFKRKNQGPAILEVLHRRVVIDEMVVVARMIRAVAQIALVTRDHAQYRRRKGVMVVMHQHPMRPKPENGLLERASGSNIPDSRQYGSLHNESTVVEALDIHPRQCTQKLRGLFINNLRAAHVQKIVDQQYPAALHLPAPFSMHKWDQAKRGRY
jgi:hypothetical protein